MPTAAGEWIIVMQYGLGHLSPAVPPIHHHHRPKKINKFTFFMLFQSSLLYFSLAMSMYVLQIPFSLSSHHLFHGRSRCGSGVSPHTISISRVSSSSSSSICLCLCVPYWKEYFPLSTEKEKQQQQRRRHHHLHSPNSNGNDDAIGVSDDVQMHSPGHEGSKISNGTQTEKAFTSNELMQRLKRYGISGVLSYGLLNTVYYLSTFLLVWFYIAPAPGRMGYAAAVERFLKVMAMVWAGSQVTKLVRAAGALALAPFVDRGLSWFTAKLNFTSQWKAFMTIVGFCFGLALLLFFAVTLLWA